MLIEKATQHVQHVLTALTQMTDDWLKKMDSKKIVGAVLLVSVQPLILLTITCC